MKAAIKSIFSWDVPNGDLKSWTPPESDFGIFVMLFIGVEGDDQSDCFDLVICTRGWFAKKMTEWKIETGQYMLFVTKFDYDAIKQYIQAYVGRCEGDSWPELASKLDHLASW